MSSSQAISSFTQVSVYHVIFKIVNDNFCRECFVYVVHATAMTVFALLFMHVQVLTRFLMAGSPILPWLAARLGPELNPALSDENKQGLTPVVLAIKVSWCSDTVQ